MMNNDVIQDQIAYYRARAGEYDEWFYRVGRYDRGAELNQAWFGEVEVVQKALYSLPRAASILELAGGTGIWTKELMNLGDHVTVVDASREVIVINQKKLENRSPQPPPHHLEYMKPDGKAVVQVDFVQADLFAWEPDRAYDMVFFGFWLSHVPPERLDGFLDKVNRALKPGGRLFALDSLPDNTSSAKNHEAYQTDGIYHMRKLNDGQEFKIVKIFYEPDALQAKLAEHGIRATVLSSGRYFWYANGVKS
jgi:demethylmenaquinone methyltransferase/2-methoxy-6-polyprenyl-1,4-benzoquinol methylase